MRGVGFANSNTEKQCENTILIFGLVHRLYWFFPTPLLSYRTNRHGVTIQNQTSIGTMYFVHTSG